jgi:hypothetical protein
VLCSNGGDILITISYDKDLFLFILLLLMAFNGIIKIIAGVILHGNEKDKHWSLADSFDGLISIGIVILVLLV